MTFQDIVEKLTASFGNKLIEINPEGLQPNFYVNPSDLKEVCLYLKNTEGLYFDMLSCITGLDLGLEDGHMEVAYNLYSIPYNHHLTIKVKFDRKTNSEELPKIPSVVNIWATANWHERETYDLMGIAFEGHPDLRRILLPNDWEGHPLRKDYKEQEKYHGVTIKYERD